MTTITELDIASIKEEARKINSRLGNIEAYLATIAKTSGDYLYVIASATQKIMELNGQKSGSENIGCKE